MKKNEKYEKLLDQLKESKPLLTETTDIEERIMNMIRQPKVTAKSEFNLFDYLFGWVYIGWMRSALVTVAVFLVGLFIYQQSLILRRIEKLEDQAVPAANQFVRMNPAVPDDNITLEKLTRLRLKTSRVSFTDKQVKELIDSYNEMEHRYKDLVRIIEEDPELKKLLEEKLTEANKKKFNL